MLYPIYLDELTTKHKIDYSDRYGGFGMSLVKAGMGRTFIGKLKHDSDILEAVKKLVDDLEISAGIFTIIGAVKRASFSFYNQKLKKYEKMDMDKPLEVVSCTGNISKIGEKTIIHSHIVLTDDEGNAYGGHLVSGTIVFAGEIYLQELVGLALIREFDETTGLNILSPKPV